MQCILHDSYAKFGTTLPKHMVFITSTAIFNSERESKIVSSFMSDWAAQIGGGVGRRLWTKVEHNTETFWSMHETTIRKQFRCKIVTGFAVKKKRSNILIVGTGWPCQIFRHKIKKSEWGKYNEREKWFKTTFYVVGNMAWTQKGIVFETHQKNCKNVKLCPAL